LNARDLAAELAAEDAAKELAGLRALRALVLAGYDVNGELKSSRRCFYFDIGGCGPIGTFTADFANEITIAARKAHR